MYSRVCFSSVRENGSRYRQCASGKGWCAHVACGMTGEGIPHSFANSTKAVQLCHQSRYGGQRNEWSLPSLEIVIHIGRGQWSQPYRIPQHGPGKDVSALPWHQYVTVYFFTVLQWFKGRYKTPRRISATGCTVLLLFGVSVTSSPDDLSTSPNSFDVWIFVFQKASCLWTVKE